MILKRLTFIRTPQFIRTFFAVLVVLGLFVLSNFFSSGNSSANTEAGAQRASETKESKQVTRNKPATKSDSGKSVSPNAQNPTTQPFMINGAGSGTANGDYVSDTDGINTSYHYWIEVPQGLDRLVVDLWDADIGLGNNVNEDDAGRDRARGNAFDTTATYTLINPAGTTITNTKFSTGTNALPVGADNAWLTFYDSTNNVRDNFGTVAYTNNDGSVNWLTNWTETNDNNNAGSGLIQITGGELRIRDDGPIAGLLSSILTRSVNLSAQGFTTATLSFSVRTENVTATTDTARVEISTNGVTWTTLETFAGAVASGSTRSYDISAFITANTRIRFTTFNGYNNTESFFVDNVDITGNAAPAAGHWELRIDESGSTGDDINAISMRAHDGTPGAGGTELNMYADSMIELGVNPNGNSAANRTYTLYPYVTSGCNCAKNDFDFDSNSGTVGSFTFTSRTAAFTQTFPSTQLSANDAWRRDSMTGFTSNGAANDYGLWTASLMLTTYVTSAGLNGNYGTFYMNTFAAAANPPTTNPPANTFRIYLPKDDATKPVKSYMAQTFSRVSGPNPPAVGQATQYEVNVFVVNPTGSAGSITFSATNLVTANVPGGGVTYVGSSANATQGTVITQPAGGGTGNITWNPGTVASGTAPILKYRVNVTPTSAGQRLPLTGTPASNGTRGVSVDETGNTTQARATFTLGPLCEIAVVQGVTTAVELQDFAATDYDDGVLLEWQTGFEADNLGFHIYREEDGKRVQVDPQLIAGSSLTTGLGSVLKSGQSYAWWDKGASKNAVYWLEDVDLNGASRWHGPFVIQAASDKSASPVKQKMAKLLSELNDGEAEENSTRVVEPTASLVSVPAAPKRTQLGLTPAPPALSGQAAVKISVKQEGWYRVAQPDLVRAGLSPNLDANVLQLTVDGQAVPMKVNANANGRFDASSSIEFYGIGLDTPVTNVRTYWLSTGSQTGSRVQTVKTDNRLLSAAGFPTTVERKNRTIYFSSLKNGEKENFFGAVVSGTPVNQTLQLTNVNTSSTGQAELEVAMQGVTVVPHRVTVQLNGLAVGDILFTGQQEGIGRFTIQHSLLQEGVNTVQLVSVNAPGDVNLVDYIRLTYQHKFIADDNALKLTLNSGEGATVDGFTSNAIRVFDVTYESEVKELSGNIQASKAGYSVSIAASGTGKRTLLLLTNDKIKAADSIKANDPSNWRNASQSADFIIITSKEFVSAIEPLRVTRQSEGYKVAVVDIEDVYDEFSYGNKSPKAVKDFLAYAKGNWRVPPVYLLLVGDASYDARNYLGYGNFDFVPTKLIDTAEMETASDDWLADFDNNNISDLYMGRLPVRTAAEASAMVNRILNYKKYPAAQSALLISDVNDEFNFEQASTQVRQVLPNTLQVEEVKRGPEGDAAAKAHLLEAIQRGQKFVNYTGHGSINLWHGNLLTSDDARALTNGNKLPLFIIMTCLNGYFNDPLLDSLGESLMKAQQGGAIAVWTSTGLTEPESQALINQEFFRLLANSKTIGEAITRAKLVTTDADVRRTWILLGDPTMSFK